MLFEDNYAIINTQEFTNRGNKMQTNGKMIINDNIYAALISLKTNVLFSKEIPKSKKNQKIYELFKNTLFSNVEKSKGYDKKLDKAAKLMVSMQEEANKNKNLEFLKVLKKWAHEAREKIPD